MGSLSLRLRKNILTVLVWGTGVVGGTAVAGSAEDAAGLIDLSLEELMDIKVSLVSRQEERLSQAPAAVFALTGEDIRRAGASSIPEALRLVPGVQVARMDASRWAVTVRGFNNRLANKLLVLIDGRSVYTPLFSGVYWEREEVMLEDVERIEVVRGPGAALWGANAVNGIINIVTKDAADTQGTLVAVAGGDEERVQTALRHGGRLDEKTAYRVYGRFSDTDASAQPGGGRGVDERVFGQGGFRLDRTADGQRFTLQGDAYYTEPEIQRQSFQLVPPYGEMLKDNAGFRGLNLLGRWQRTPSSRTGFELQLFYDLADQESDFLDVTRHTLDLDWQHRLSPTDAHELVWGAGLRYNRDASDGTFTVALDPRSRTSYRFSAFVQDRIHLVPDRLELTLGSKFEHNSFTGFEVQPGGRLLWQAAADQVLWAAVSRAVRTPSRSEEDLRFINLVIPPDEAAGVPPVVTGLEGNRGQKSESVVSYEAGYRFNPPARVSLDVAGFYSRYADLLTASPAEPVEESGPAGPYVFLPIFTGNSLKASTYGVEAVGTWQALDAWRLRASYTYLEMDFDAVDGVVSPLAEAGENPRHQLGLQSLLDLPRGLQADAFARYVDRLPSVDVDAYVELTLRLAWRPRPGLSLELIGKNLLDDRHAEFIPGRTGELPALVERGLQGRVRWSF